ncbi:MAG TPA: 16S rRNA (guanine(966)-N(2))-methyltransferase RsmD, partial [Pseudorhodoferax sp.]|nr:16S rRNA (guanine(966)-N(2))-methyltransferase RsmD [Pseudorhodoferax sp.]
YLEASEHWGAERLAAHGLAELRHLKAGAVHAHLLGRA